MNLLDRLRKRLSIGQPKPRGALVVADKSVLPRLTDNAIRLKRSIRHDMFGLTVIYAHQRGEDDPAIPSDRHVLTITVMPEPQPDVLTLDQTDPPSRLETPLETSIRMFLNGRRPAPDGHEVTRPLQTVQSITISVTQTSDPHARRCLGELFSDESNAVLLESVLEYLPPSDILHLTRVCRTVSLVIGRSARLQLRLKRLYYAISPDHVLQSKNATTAQQTAWLHEWQERLDRLRPHYSAVALTGIPHHVHSDGVMHLFKERARLPTEEPAFITTFTVRRTALPKERADDSSPVVLSLKLEDALHSGLSARISTENDLLVTYQRHRVTAGSTGYYRRAVWRLHFYKLTLSTARPAIGPNRQTGQDHPSARLPFMDIVTEERHPWDPDIEVQVGPGGVLLFGCMTVDHVYEQMAFILDWQKGEARGVMITLGPEPIRQPMSHELVDASHLLTGIYCNPIRNEKDERHSGACLWLSHIPLAGQRPQRLATLEAAEQGTPEYDQCFTITHSDIPRICPEAAFWLPPFTGSGKAGVHYGHGMPIFGGETCLTSLSSSPTGSDNQESLALFTVYGTMEDERTVGETRPLQCSVVVPVSRVIALWREKRAGDMGRLTTKGYEQHRAACHANMNPAHDFVWDSWQKFAHVFFLNAVLPPALHGSKLVIGLSDRYEENPPFRFDDEATHVTIPVEDLSLVIRDFNPNRTALDALDISRRLGLPPSMAAGASASDSVSPHCETATPMPVRSTRVARHGSNEDTRSMFVEPFMWGGLAYTEVAANLPSRVKEDLAEARHMRHTDGWQPRKLAVVSSLEFDGEDITVRTASTPSAL